MRTIVLTLTAVLLVGCTPTQPTSSPSVSVGPVIPATPEYHCTPDGSQTAAPCTEAEYRAQLERDQQYAEAEAIYRKMVAADADLFRRGLPADESVLQYVSGRAKEAVIAGHATGDRSIAGDLEIRWVRRLPGVSREGSVVALETCVDNSSVEIRGADGSTGFGTVGTENVYFVDIDGTLKAVYIDYLEVEQC